MKISKALLLAVCGAALVLLPRRSSKAELSPNKQSFESNVTDDKTTNNQTASAPSADSSPV